MQSVSTIARYLLGFSFTFFGLNGYLHFIHEEAPSSALGLDFIRAVSASHFLSLTFLLQTLAGIGLVVEIFVPLVLTVLAGIIANILLYHLTMDPVGLGPGVLVAVLWVLVFLRYRSSFQPRFQMRPLWARPD